MYSMGNNMFGGGLMNWLPDAKTSMSNATAASSFIEDMNQRRARSEMLPMQLYNSKLGTGYDAMMNKIKLDMADNYNSQNNFNKQTPVDVNRDQFLREVSMGTMNVPPSAANVQYYSPNAGITPQVQGEISGQMQMQPQQQLQLQQLPQLPQEQQYMGEVTRGYNYPMNPTLSQMLGK